MPSRSPSSDHRLRPPLSTASTLSRVTNSLARIDHQQLVGEMHAPVRAADGIGLADRADRDRAEDLVFLERLRGCRCGKEGQRQAGKNRQEPHGLSSNIR